MLTLARADYSPYGLDFPYGATGRFTNGRTFVDVLAQLLGFPDYIPPYNRIQSGQALLQGANYASGASGIRDETGNILGDHMSFNQQIESFARTVHQLRRYFRGDGNNTLFNHLSKCIFYSGLGSNDHLNNYFMRDYYTTGEEYTPTSYADVLLQDYTKQLMALHSLGARKVIVPAVGQIGCIHFQLARYDANGSRCNEEINNAISLFNTGLKRLVDRFNRGLLPGARFVYLDSFQGSQILLRIQEHTDLMWWMRDAVVSEGTTGRKHAFRFKCRATNGINTCFGMHFIPQKQQTSFLLRKHTVLRLNHLLIPLIYSSEPCCKQVSCLMGMQSQD